MRRGIIIITTFIGGLFFFLEFVLPEQWFGNPNIFSEWMPTVNNFLMIVGSFAVGIGVINLVAVHGQQITKKGPAWINSAGFFTGLILMLLFGFGQDVFPVFKTGFNFLFQYMVVPLGATIFSLLAFYIVSAAYRAFKIKTTDAMLMTLTAFIVILGQVPFGNLISQSWPHFLQFPCLSAWIMNNLNSAASRGVLFGSAVGALAISLRIWLSLEKGSFFEKGS